MRKESWNRSIEEVAIGVDSRSSAKQRSRIFHVYRLQASFSSIFKFTPADLDWWDSLLEQVFAFLFQNEEGPLIEEENQVDKKDFKNLAVVMGLCFLLIAYRAIIALEVFRWFQKFMIKNKNEIVKGVYVHSSLGQIFKVRKWTTQTQTQRKRKYEGRSEFWEYCRCIKGNRAYGMFPLPFTSSAEYVVCSGDSSGKARGGPASFQKFIRYQIFTNYFEISNIMKHLELELKYVRNIGRTLIANRAKSDLQSILRRISRR